MKVLHPSLPFPGFQDEQFVGASVCFSQNEISFKCLSMQCTQHGFSHMGYIQYVSIWNEMKLPEWSQGTTSALPAGACASSWIPGFIFGQACDVFFSPQVMIECSHVKVHQWWPCKNIQTCLHTYINIYIYVLWIQESIYVFILHCRILTSPEAKQAAEASADGAAASSSVPGFCIKHLIKQFHVFHKSWMNECLHVKSFGKSTVVMQTHTNISTLFEIYDFFYRSKSLSKQFTLLSYTYGRHSLVSKPNYQQRK